MSKHYVRVIISITFIILIITWIIWGNSALELNTYGITSAAIPESFDNYRIAHVSDLHNTDNKQLLNMLREAKPDVIAITGDLIDSRRTDIPFALQFAEEAMKIAPCYYVTGNHESRISEYETLKSGLITLGVVVLDNRKVIIERSDEIIAIAGVNDPSFHTDYLYNDPASIMNTNLESLIEADTYTILLAHKPELFVTYVRNGVDLVLSGHMHGGQFRIPFLGGLYAPSQGFFPQYDSGTFTKDNTTMVVSRGIGNSLFPFRINNRPEIILIELKAIH